VVAALSRAALVPVSRRAGWAGHGDHVERSIGLIALLKEKLWPGWHIANDSSLGVLCVEPPPRLGQSARSSTG